MLNRKIGVISFLVVSIFFINFISADIQSDCNIYGICKPVSTTGNTYTNNTYQNITNNYYNATVNSTQFDSNNPITITISWITNLINSLIGSNTNGYYNSSNPSPTYNATSLLTSNIITNQNITSHDINATGTINALENFSIAGVKGYNGMVQVQCNTTLSVNFISQTFLLTPQYKNLTYSGGILTAVSTCA